MIEDVDSIDVKAYLLKPSRGCSRLGFLLLTTHKMLYISQRFTLYYAIFYRVVICRQLKF